MGAALTVITITVIYSYFMHTLQYIHIYYTILLLLLLLLLLLFDIHMDICRHLFTSTQGNSGLLYSLVATR